MPSLNNYNGAEFANLVLGQGGFNKIDGTKIHLAASEIPNLQITRLSKVSTTTRVYCDNNPSLFATSDQFTIDNAGPLFDSNIHGVHTVNWSGTSYFNCNHTWPAELGLVNDYYPADQGFPAASATYVSGAVYNIYPDIEQWSVVQVIARKPLGSTDIDLADIYGNELTISGVTNGILDVTGVSFPGRWVRIATDDNIIIAYRG